MPLRPCARSLSIPIPSVPQWNAPRPPTPYRSSFPQPSTTSEDMPRGADPDAPPVPPLSYWEPDTPEALTSSISLRKPFLSSPLSLSPGSHWNPAFMLPVASPILPASPLSIFDRMASPMTPSFLFPQTPPVPTSPLTPTFLKPRTPPLPSSSPNLVQAGRRHSTMNPLPCGDVEKLQLQQQYEALVSLRDNLRKVRETRRADSLMQTEEESKTTNTYFQELGDLDCEAKQAANAAKQSVTKRLMKQKSLKALRAVLAHA